MPKYDLIIIGGGAAAFAAATKAVEQLGPGRKQEPDGSIVVVSACAPLNLAGV